MSTSDVHRIHTLVISFTVPRCFTILDLVLSVLILFDRFPLIPLQILGVGYVRWAHLFGLFKLSTFDI